jgi:oxygen-dependent protoporphyrinogen oxidase
MSDVVIIGAGISGLSCAWTLKQLGIEAVILESSSRPGGVIRTESIDGFLIEWGPNSFQPARAALKMIEEIGLWDELLPPAPNSPRFIYVNGSLRKFPFGPLSFGGIARILREPLVRSKSTKDESVHDFFTRRFGRQAHDRLVGPMLMGIYAADTKKLSMAAVFPRMIEMERQYGSLMGAMLRSFTGRSISSSTPSPSGASSWTPSKPKPRGSIFSFSHGMETLPNRIADRVTIKYNVADARIGDAPVTVISVPAYRAADIVADTHAELATLLRKVQYAPMVIAATALPEDSFNPPLRGFGFLAPRDQGLHVLGTLFSSALFPDRAPEGKVLFTTFVGGAFEPEAVDWPDQRVWETVCLELQRVLKTAAPEPVSLVRHRHAIPQYIIGHERWVESVNAELRKSPGLFLTSNYLTGVSVPGCMEQGERTAHAVAEYLGRKE